MIEILETQISRKTVSVLMFPNAVSSYKLGDKKYTRGADSRTEEKVAWVFWAKARKGNLTLEYESHPFDDYDNVASQTVAENNMKRFIGMNEQEMDSLFGFSEKEIEVQKKREQEKENMRIKEIYGNRMKYLQAWGVSDIEEVGDEMLYFTFQGKKYELECGESRPKELPEMIHNIIFGWECNTWKFPSEEK